MKDYRVIITDSSKCRSFISHAIVDTGSSAGWRVSTDLEANYLYVTTRQTAAEAACPDGIVGGYDRDRDADFDDSFSVECHNDLVQVPCCLSVSVNATRSDNEDI